jgi:hypothetical protein
MSTAKSRSWYLEEKYLSVRGAGRKAVMRQLENRNF